MTNKAHNANLNVRAFTLIELLVVIGIIGLLLGILLPTLALAKKKARSAVCKSNLKNVALGLGLYYEDNKAYPECQRYYIDSLNYPPRYNIISVLKPYLDAGIFKCPDDTQNNNTIGWYGIYNNSYVWQNAYHQVEKGREGYRTFVTSKGSFRYKVPMLNDVVPNHKKEKKWPGKEIVSGNGGVWLIDNWLSENLKSLNGFNSVWPDTHVEKGLGSDYQRYLAYYISNK